MPFTAIFHLLNEHKKSLENAVFSRLLAEKEGFEPSRQLSHPTPLAGIPYKAKKACIYRHFSGSISTNDTNMLPVNSTFHRKILLPYTV